MGRTRAAGRSGAPTAAYQTRGLRQRGFQHTLRTVGVGFTSMTSSPPPNPCTKDDAFSRSVALSSVWPILANSAPPERCGFGRSKGFVHARCYCCSFKISNQSAIEGEISGPFFFVTDGGLNPFFGRHIHIQDQMWCVNVRGGVFFWVRRRS